jgi:hypothetical protein
MEKGSNVQIVWDEHNLFHLLTEKTWRKAHDHPI